MPKEPKIRSLHIFAISPEKCRVWSWFLPADKHKSFLQVDTITLVVHSQACPEYQKLQVCNISRKTWRMKLIFCLQINIKGFFKVSSFISGLSMNGMWSHSHVCTHASTYLSLLSLHMQNSIWRVNQVCSVILLQMIHHVKLIFIPRNPLYCIIFGSKQISATDAQEHFSPADAKHWRR